MVVDEINKHYGTDLPKPIEVRKIVLHGATKAKIQSLPHFPLA